MADVRRNDALQFIFSLFLGVLLVVVVGVGVWTFYPPPFSENNPKQQELQELYRQQETTNFKGGSDMTPAEEAEYERIQKQINELQRELEQENKRWAVNTSIIVLTIATVLMAISLFLPDAARVFSNGILLGGLFTVLYGTGVSFTGGDSRARFWVVLVALVLAIVFGYLRFIRGQRRAHEVEVAAAATGVVATDADLAARVSALESRFAALTAAFSGTNQPPQ